MRWKAIFTTNYDYGIQRAYELLSNPLQNPVTITHTPEIAKLNYDNRFQVPIFHLHGVLFGSSNSQIIITEDDYIKFRERRHMMFEKLKFEAATSTILYIGYSNRDPNWKKVLDELRTDFYPSEPPISYRVDPNTDPLDIELLRSKKIETIATTFEDFSRETSAILSKIPITVDSFEALRQGIPHDLLPAFEKNPASVVRLLNSWTYVNAVSFHETPNLREFVKGNLPNWGLIGHRQIFERDIEEEIFETLLDYVTNVRKKASITAMLAPAGYGITTLMMTLAAGLVREKAGAVFMLKPGQVVLEGDVFFACSLFPDNAFFFVDNAADHIKEINDTIGKLRDTNVPALFVAGERLNEWRQKRGKSNPEFILESLSDPEIERLLDYLGQNAILGKLEHLSREMQVAAIRERHGKDLLVVMREATEGKSFDAILEDEYRSIIDITSRRLYLLVCCFYQHGAYARDKVLAKILDKPLTELYQITAEATEGVVIFDCTNEARQEYAARARHRTIAITVWERFGEPGEREWFIQEALDALNLHYSVDKKSFDDFVRSDRLIDSISTFEGKTRFFDEACRKEPDSPYVRQHYARMLLREKQTRLALDVIENAIRSAPNIKVLYHTRGLILAHMAITTPSLEIARKWLAQSEASFRNSMKTKIRSKDEYDYQGLAQLYFDWAKHVRASSDEYADYLRKAEEIINDGIKNAQRRDGLWIISSQIQEEVGNQPSSLLALEKAVQDVPNSIVARYLLGRAYRKKGEPTKAISTLDHVIKHHIDECRCFVEYALALLATGKGYKEAIAVLNQSTRFGLSDPRFIATLGGLYFLEGDYTQADKIFQEVTKRNFTGEELTKIQFYPPNPNNLSEYLQIEGTVVNVKPGYSFVKPDMYPELICPASKFGGVNMSKGLRIRFELAFRAKGGIVLNPIVC